MTDETDVLALREALEEERERFVALEMADRFAIATGGTAELSEDDFRAALDHLIALAATPPTPALTAARLAVERAFEVEPFFHDDDRIRAMDGTVRRPRTMADAVEAYRERVRTRALTALAALATPDPEVER